MNFLKLACIDSDVAPQAREIERGRVRVREREGQMGTKRIY